MFAGRVSLVCTPERGVKLATEREPSIRAVWLGQELRQIREAKKISLRDAAGYLGKVQSSLSRMETGHYPVREDEVVKYLDLCGIKDPHKRTDLLTMCRDVGQRGWWDGYDGDVAGTLMDRLWIEARTVSIRVCQVNSIPGLLQTPEYASALMRVGDLAIDDREMERWIEVRMTRQHILTRHHPVEMHALIDESILYRLPGDREVRRGQLDYLAHIAERPNVEIRVIPMSICHAVNGPFEVMKLTPPYPTVGYLATSAGDICVEGDALDQLTHTYDRLEEASLDPEASREMIIAERNKL